MTLLFPTKRWKYRKARITHAQVSSQLAKGKAIYIMCTSIIKPISGNWIVYTYDCIGNVPDIIMNGFCKAGIVSALDH